jgi:hypothetical protein
MEAYFQALTDKPYVMDKSRDWGVHFDLLQLIFEAESKIVCLERDLRQILASMEKKFRQNPDKYRLIENHANLSGTTTLKRAMIGLQSAPVGGSFNLDQWGFGGLHTEGLVDGGEKLGFDKSRWNHRAK